MLLLATVVGRQPLVLSGTVWRGVSDARSVRSTADRGCCGQAAGGGTEGDWGLSGIAERQDESGFYRGFRHSMYSGATPSSLRSTHCAESVIGPATLKSYATVSNANAYRPAGNEKSASVG